MARIKYYYDTETCKYERIEKKTSDVLFSIGLFLLSVFVISLSLVLLSYKFEIFHDHEISILERENDFLKNQNTVIEGRIAEIEKGVDALIVRDEDLYRGIFDEFVASSLDPAIRKAGTGGADDYEKKISFDGDAKDLVISKLEKTDALTAKIKVQNASYKELELAAKQYDKMLASKPAIQPISNKELTRLASGFGMRIHPILKVRKMHTGIDFTAKRGTPIYATGDGVISKVKRSLGGYGNELEINHGFGYVTKYAHLQNFNVKHGQKVKRGDVIGYVGNTGRSTAPHLHYEVIYKGKKVNPVYYFFKDLNDEQYEKILELASKENKSLS